MKSQSYHRNANVQLSPTSLLIDNPRNIMGQHQMATDSLSLVRRIL